MAAKLCARCGAQYANIRSATCPQCFARLLTIDDVTASKLTTAREEEENSAEYKEAKAADDERFRHESFSACLSVVGILVVTLIVSAALLIASNGRRHRARIMPPEVTARSSAVGLIPYGPQVDASLDTVLPQSLNGFTRESASSSINVPGTLTTVYSATYQPTLPTPPPAGRVPAPGRGSLSATLTVFAIPSGLPTVQSNQFELSVAFAAQAAGAQPRPFVFFATEHWQYGLIGTVGKPEMQVKLESALSDLFAARR